MLEHARGFLDQRPPGLGARVQDVVELALPDDHVHLPAQSGVGQQLLHVKQAAVIAVDGVLALPGPEHQAADRDFRVLDGQGAVAVVDGERDLGPAERRARGGAREDHVLHLAAAQRLDPLLAHHPGQGVDHVGFAGAVRADYAGDTGLKVERCGGSERLEATQSEALQVHVPSLLSASRTLPPRGARSRQSQPDRRAGRSEDRPREQAPPQAIAHVPAQRKTAAGPNEAVSAAMPCGDWHITGRYTDEEGRLGGHP